MKGVFLGKKNFTRGWLCLLLRLKQLHQTISKKSLPMYLVCDKNCYDANKANCVIALRIITLYSWRDAKRDFQPLFTVNEAN